MPHAMIEALESRELLSTSRDLLYVRVRFSDQTAWPESLTAANDVTAKAATLMNQYTGDAIRLRTAVKDVALSHSTSYYKSKGTGTIANDVDAALKAAGVNLGSYEHVSYRYNGPIGSFGGLGQVPGKRTWIRYTSTNILIHELGHNLGLGHSKFANPTDNAKPFGAAKLTDYGDVFSNMGSGGTKDWNAHQKWAKGWMPSAGVKTLDTAKVGTQTVTLTTHDNADTFASGKTYLIRLTMGGTALYVSARKGINGVFLHRAPSSKPAGGELIDAKPKTDAANDAYLNSGSSITWDRSGNDIRIAAESTTGGIRVTVTLGNPAAVSAQLAASAPAVASLFSATSVAKDDLSDGFGVL